MHLNNRPYQDQLVRGLAHKMNNILTLFHGYVGLMLDNRDLDHTTRANLSKIKEGACAASELIDRTHALVRPSAVAPHEVDLSDFMELLGPALRVMCGKQIALKIEISPTTPRLNTDSGRLRTALLELVKNACDATDQAGGAVHIHVQEASAPEGFIRLGAEGDWVSLAVIDNGSGIPVEVAPRIFQPFFSTKRRKNSAGLGLNVASEAVQHLGGVLRHVHQSGETRFEILLPTVATGP